MLMQGQQVEMCYMGIEDSKNAFKKTMDFIANPSSSSAGLICPFGGIGSSQQLSYPCVRMMSLQSCCVFSYILTKVAVYH